MDLFATSENAHCPLFFSVSLPAERGHVDITLASNQAACVSSDQEMLPLVLCEISDTNCPKPALVPRLDGTAGGTALADPRQEAYAIPGGGLGVELEPGTMEPSCVIASGVSEEMGAVIGGNATLLCNWYRLPVASLTAGLSSVPITESFSVMSPESS